MSLHDRIMKEVDAFPFNTMSTHVSQSHLDTYVEGFERAKQQSAQLAKEADELVAEMAEALEQAVTSMQDSGYRSNSVVVMAAKQALNTYMERNNEQ